MSAPEITTAEKYRQYLNLSSIASIEPVTIDHGLGAKIWDTSGKQYIDCFAGISVVNSGHSDPRILAAARAQMDRFVHCGTLLYEVPVVADLAQKLAEISPGRLQKTFFCNSGAEAVEGALRLAKAHTGRSDFIALQGSFHGRTNATLSVTGNRQRKQRGGPYLPGVAFAPTPHPYRCRMCHGRCDLQCAEAVRDVIEFQTSGEVAAFIAEPLMGEGGIIVPPPGYFERVKRILDEFGILLIVDEVQSGFGRTGKLFGIEHYAVEPDIMCMAKGIADGFPLGGFIARPEVADSFRPGEHLSTFGGNPVCCAAAVANIEVIDSDNLCQRSSDLGSWLKAQLESLAARHSVIGDVRGRGLMMGLELVEDRQSKRPAAKLAGHVKASLRERGVLVGVGGHFGNVVRLQPPLVIDPGDLGLVTETLDAVLEDALANSAIDG